MDATWSWFAGPSRLRRLGAASLAGLAAAAGASFAGVAEGLAEQAGQSELARRAYLFFELHNPLTSWWIILLTGATALSLVACAIEGRAGLVRFVRRARPRPPGTTQGEHGGEAAHAVEPASPMARSDNARVTRLPEARLPRVAADRAASVFGSDARRSFQRGQIAVSRAPRLLGVGQLLLAVGSVLAVASLVVDRHAAVSGELVLREGETVDRAFIKAPFGEERKRRLGLTVTMRSLEDEAITLDVSGETVTLPLGRIAPSRAGIFDARLIRATSGGESFTVAVTQRESGEEAVATVGRGEPLELPDGRSSALRILAYEPDLLGLGPAVRVGAGALRGGALGEDPVWLLARYPSFHRDNGRGPYALTLMEVLPRREAIVGIQRRPAPWLTAAGLVTALLGLALMLVGARGGKAVFVRDGLVFGVPDEDPLVRRALEAAAS